MDEISPSGPDPGGGTREDGTIHGGDDRPGQLGMAIGTRLIHWPGGGTPNTMPVILQVLEGEEAEAPGGRSS